MSDGALAQLIWRKSSFSALNGGTDECVEVGAADWRKSSYSASNGGTDQCVEVGQAPNLVALRDSKNPSGPVVSFSPEEWKRFLSALRTGEFDL